MTDIEIVTAIPDLDHDFEPTGDDPPACAHCRCQGAGGEKRSVPVATPADRTADAAGDQQDCADSEENDPDPEQDGDRDQESEDEQDDAEDDHLRASFC